MSPNSPPPLGDILGNIIISIIPNAVNDFTNNKTLNAFSRQKLTLYSILNGLKTNSIDSYESYFNLATAIVVNSKANNADKAVLYIALAIAEINYKYWQEKIAIPGDWSTYLNSNEAINYASLPYWINASFKGSL